MQDTDLRAVKNLESYLAAPKVHPVVWLRLIGKHLVAETHRRHFRAKRDPNQEARDNVNRHLANQLTDSMPSVVAKLSQAELVEKVMQRIDKLPDNDREILEMRHTDEMSLKQISKTLDISIDAAKKRYYRALDRFREISKDIVESH